MTLYPLKGSARQPMPGARAVGKADPAEQLQVSMFLRSRDGTGLTELMKKLAKRENTGRHLSREEFAQRFGADNADIAAVEKFASAHGLTIVQEHPGQRTVKLAGTVARFNAAFGVDLQRFEYPGGSYRGYLGPVQMPDQLHDPVEAVLGLDNRPAAEPQFRVRARADDGMSFTPIEIAGFYDFPPGIGQGECVGIVELGGGARADDLEIYFSGLGINPLPTVSLLSVDGAVNDPMPHDPQQPDHEVMLDIEVVGAIAPGARLAVYFAPNTDAGFVDCVTTAIHDTNNHPSVVSISWAKAELLWGAQAMTAMDLAFQAAAAMGITVCVATGDFGSSAGLTDGSDHVEFPASSPHVLACGGTALVPSGTNFAEVVWNDAQAEPTPQTPATGGGVSVVFPVPAWQNGLQFTRSAAGSNPAPLLNRGVPDVSGDADPNVSGWKVRVDGANIILGGTSAVAPLWAALVARINAAKGSSIGFINPQLYASPSAMRDIMIGDNGSFKATQGWDACTGFGSPNGAAVAALFGQTRTS